MILSELIAIARGDVPADLVLKNARIVNTLTAEIEEGDVAIYQGYVAGIGDYGDGKKVLELDGRFLVPGLVDGHVHLESG